MTVSTWPSTRPASAEAYVRANAAAVSASITIDVLVILGSATLVVLMLAELGAIRWVLAAGAAFVALIIIIVFRSVTGVTPGNALLGLRTVWMPVAIPAAVWKRPQATLHVRSGADPLRVTPSILDVDAAEPAQFQAGHVSRLTLVFDDGTRETILRSALIGRDPSRLNYPGHMLVDIPDLGRTMSRTHALIEIRPTGVWITDLHSENGTRVDGQRTVAGEATRVGLGVTVHMGDRHMRIEGRTFVGEASMLETRGEAS